jgi:hypothetical protein
MENYEVEIGKFYHFWDDGKSSISRHYLCKCEGIITLEESAELLYHSYYWSHDDGETVALTLKEIWERNKLECNWLYADETPYFVVVSCPKYDDNLLYCAKTKDGQWFSMDVKTWWQSGLLDVGEKKLNALIEEYTEYINHPKISEESKERYRNSINEHLNVEY